MSNTNIHLEFDPSDLGTKSYWEKSYVRELKNYRHNGDVGEVWFGEDSTYRVADWITNCCTILKHHSILDLGCGNGFTLISLATEGYHSLYGVDYCSEAIQLAMEFAKEKDFSITYAEGNIVSLDGQNEIFNRKYDICHDKGTYDALSLSPDDPIGTMVKYIQNVHQLLIDNGLLILTSGNWTQEEIISHFKDYFTLHEVIPSPKFMFGGKVGSSITSIVMKKIVSDL